MKQRRNIEFGKFVETFRRRSLIEKGENKIEIFLERQEAFSSETGILKIGIRENVLLKGIERTDGLLIAQKNVMIEEAKTTASQDEDRNKDGPTKEAVIFSLRIFF